METKLALESIFAKTWMGRRKIVTEIDSELTRLIRVNRIRITIASNIQKR